MRYAWQIAPVALWACAALGVGCGSPAPPVEEPLPVVKESFEVGPDIYVRSLAFEAATGSLWVGTSIGVVEVDTATSGMRNTFTRKHGLANEYVFGIGIDPDGHKWFGTNAGGMTRYKAGDWKTFFPMHGLADYWIYTFANHPDGSLWIGTWAGANRLDRETLAFTTYREELVNEWVYGLDIDAEGTVWFGTEGGVSRFDGTSWQHWTHDDGMGASNGSELEHSPNTGLGTRSRHDLGVLAGGEPTYNPNYVFALLADDDGSIWVGTWGGGVGHLVDGVWTNYTTADGLIGDIVFSLFKDSRGHYWFGTASGLTRYDGTRWTSWNQTNGLVGNPVYGIAESADGDIWVGSRGGVSRIGPPQAAPPAQEE